MNNFTMSTALHYIKKHSPVTIILAIGVFFIFSTLPILDNKFQMSKNIVVGYSPEKHKIKLLNKDAILAILASEGFRNELYGFIDKDRVAKYKVDPHKSNNNLMISLNIKGSSYTSVLDTSILIMNQLRRIDQSKIDEKIKLINKLISKKKDTLHSLRISRDSKNISNDEIEQFVNMQKVYDRAYNQNVINNVSSNALSVYRFQYEKSLHQIEKEEKIDNLMAEINDLEHIVKNGYKNVSYLLPVSDKSISIYFPNTLVFLGFSLFVAVFYNLIILTYYHRKLNK